jgi:hypothetical protein
MPLRRNSLRRRSARLESRPRVLIVCEGRKTEPSYITDVNRDEEVRLVDIIIEKGGGTPKSVVERAVAMKRESEKEAARRGDDLLAYDEVWCVFDVDEHPMLKEAQQQARDNEIKLAISNPCFELWFVLHFQEQNAHIHRHDVQRMCRAHLKGYKKEANYADLREGYPQAVERAAKLEERHARDGQPGVNPSTAIYRLTERLRSLGRDQRLRAVRSGLL